MEVRKSPVPLNETVQGSTRTSYCLVPSCTVSFRGTGHLGTVLILQCTALYSDVSTCRFQRNFSVSKHSTCWYMPVYTGVYQHVPAYTNTYQIVKVCTDSHLHIIFYTSICQYIPALAYTAHYCTYWYILVCAGIYWYVLVCASIYWHVPI
jgi:hypothetical protein